MDRIKIDEILEKHKKWLNDEEGGVYADLNGSNLRNSNLSYSDLRYSHLNGSDLSGSNLGHSKLSDSDLNGNDLSGSDLSYSDLSHSNLSGSNLIGSDLSGSNLLCSNLSGSNLSGSNIDYSCWPLWCRSLDVHIDDRIARQILYHLMRPCLVSPDVSEDFKRALFTPELIAEANAFHRVEECGKIVSPYEEENHGQSN